MLVTPLHFEEDLAADLAENVKVARAAEKTRFAKLSLADNCFFKSFIAFLKALKKL